MPIQKILVPVDGSEPALRALNFAVEVATAMGASLELVTVLDLGQLDFYDGMYRTIEQIESWQEEIRSDILMRALDTLPDDRPPTTTTMLKGAAVKALLAHINDSEPDMVVMGRTGRSAVNRILHGSVSSRISAASPVPVTLVG
ncbi:MAG: universal stress protein [Myxococcota bacterium]